MAFDKSRFSADYDFSFSFVKYLHFVSWWLMIYTHRLAAIFSFRIKPYVLCHFRSRQARPRSCFHGLSLLNQLPSPKRPMAVHNTRATRVSLTMQPCCTCTECPAHRCRLLSFSPPLLPSVSSKKHQGVGLALWRSG